MSTESAHEPECVDPSDARVIDLVIEGRPGGVGTIAVARLLPSPKRRMVGPFIFIDHLGPIALPPGEGFDVRPHPHIGLSTVTYFFSGENVHRDSLGNVQVNRPGDVNVMTAGRGIVHSERADPAFRAAGGTLHAAQIWLALPDDREDDAPSFEHHPETTLPTIEPAPGVTGRILLGAAYAARSPIRHPSDPLLVDLKLDPGAALAVPPDIVERAVVVIEGELQLGGQNLACHQLAVLIAGAPVEISARSTARVMLIGGPPIGERFIEWNFVASSRDKIARARDAWKARQFPTIPTDDKDFIPWPEDPR